MNAPPTCPHCEAALKPSEVGGHYCPGSCGWLEEDGRFIVNGGPPAPPSENGATVQRSREGLFEACRTLAREERILDRLRELLPEIGLVGEDDNALLIYLATTSRLFASRCR